MDGTSINSEKLRNYVENNLTRNEIQIEENQINNSDIKPKYIIHSLKDLFNILEI